jgi:integrase
MARNTPAMPSRPYLQLRGNTYYFRIRIPSDLKHLYDGKDAIKRSLETSDRREASRRLDEAVSRQTQEFSRFRSRLTASPLYTDPKVVQHLDEDLIERIANTFAKALLEGDQVARRESFGQPINQQRPPEPQSNPRRILETLKAILGGRQPAQLLDRITGEALYFTGITLGHQVTEDDMRRQQYQLAKTLVRVLEAQIERNDGQDTQTEAVVDTRKVLPTAGSTRSGPDQYYAVFDKWAKPGFAAQTERTQKDYRRVWNAFAEHLNYKDILTVTQADVREYRDALMRQGDEFRTVRKKVGQIKSLFAVAAEYNLVPSNPAAGVKVAAPKVGKPRRQGYEIVDLNKIFRSPIYKNNDRPKAGAGEAAYWLPLLALFHGARLEELGQLRTTDIQQIERIWVMDITDEPDHGTGAVKRRRVKTDESRRTIPLHPAVIKLGFLEFVRKQKKDGHDLLFHHLTPDNNGSLTGNWSKWWGRYARSTIGIKDKTKVFHSFRHAFKTECRRVGIEEQVHDYITGHSQKSVGRAYGKEPLTRLVSDIRRITYSGVKLPA